MRAPQRRIDDRIRNLCARVMADGDVGPVLQELLELVHQKVEVLKVRAARVLLKGERLEPERRSTDVTDAEPKASQTADEP